MLRIGIKAKRGATHVVRVINDADQPSAGNRRAMDGGMDEFVTRFRNGQLLPMDMHGSTS